MQIFVAGATGALGRPLVAQLLAAGHQVIGMTHSTERVHVLAEQGAEPVVVNALNAEAVHAVIARIQPEVVIEQLTALPKTYTPESMKAAAPLDASIRLEGGANVQAAAQAFGVRRYIIQSTGFWYAPGLGLADETAPFAFDATPAVAAGTRMYADLERRVLSAPKLEGIALRYGFFYGPGTWYTANGDVAEQIRQQNFPIIGGGSGVWSFVHVEDAAKATATAVLRGVPGAYNITNDQPLEMSMWLPAYAEWVGAKPPRHLTASEVNDPDQVYYATRLRGASNAKAKRELSFQPRPFEWLTQTSIASSS